MASFLCFPFFLLFFLLLLSTTTSIQTFSYANHGKLRFNSEYLSNFRELPVPRDSSYFKLCFFNTTPNSFYLGLRMGSTRSESTLRWVWQPTYRPVDENARFTLRPDGNLLLSNSKNLTIWSTETSNKGVVGLKITASGNVVLYDKQGRFVWQSFDHPSDSLLVSQSLFLAPSKPNKIVSRNKAYSLAIDAQGFAMYINNIAANPVAYFNFSDTGIFPDRITKIKFDRVKARTLGNAPGDELHMLVSPYGWNISFGEPKFDARLSFLRIEDDGDLVVHTFYSPVDNAGWEEVYRHFGLRIGWVSRCALPSMCGSLGLCEDEMCVGCPTAKGTLGWSKKCAMPVLGSCGGGAVGYYKVEGVENYLNWNGGGEGVVKVEECRRRCSLDCKCVGFLYWEKESKCWLANMMGTLSQVSDLSHVAYIKFVK